MNYNLKRFIKPQNKYYPLALKEIKAGKKQTHWIWFIFPQLKGLGISDYSKYYGIAGLDEAKQYMENDVLRARLIEITQALERKNKPLVSIVGDIDAQKIHACMTLFYIATKENCFKNILIKYFNGYFHTKTIKLLKLKSYNMNEAI